MSFDAQKYNEDITTRAQEGAELKSIRLDVPEYIYQIIENSAQQWDTHRTNAFIRLVRSGDFLRYVGESDAQIIIRDENGEETLINLETEAKSDDSEVEEDKVAEPFSSKD